MTNALAAALTRCATALALPGQPDALHAAVERETKSIIDHRLFTLLVTTGDGRVRRIYTSDPAAYPVGGFKAMGPTPWGDLVLTRMQPFLGNDVAAIRWAFPDHALIESLGLGAVINLPIVYDGQIIGTANLLDAAGAYGPEKMALAQPFGGFLIPGFLGARATAG